MIVISRDKCNRSVEYLIPMKDESNSEMFKTSIATWVYYCDGKRHGKIPVMILPGLINLFGGEDHIRSIGYHKYWNVFLDEDTGEFTFGNRTSYAKSPLPEDQHMVHISPLLISIYFNNSKIQVLVD